MAFSNLYDSTFPADTELANLIGANLRQLRVDVQQRMAAISGLDAAKPNFAGDAQPTGWNGILFFAVDTGKVYQFNNPSWTDVTTSFFANSGLRYLGTGGIAFTANTALTASLLGNWGQFANAGLTVTLPLLSTTTIGQTFMFVPGANAGTIAGSGADPILNQGVSSGSIPIAVGQGIQLAVNGSGGVPANWYVTDESPGIIVAPATHNYIWLGPLLIQWALGTTDIAAGQTTAHQTINWPIPFPTAVLAVFVSCNLPTSVGNQNTDVWYQTAGGTLTGVNVQKAVSHNNAGAPGSWATATTPVVIGIGY